MNLLKKLFGKSDSSKVETQDKELPEMVTSTSLEYSKSTIATSNIKIFAARSPKGNFMEVYEEYKASNDEFNANSITNMFNLPDSEAISDSVYLFANTLWEVRKEEAKSMLKTLGINDYQTVDSQYDLYRILTLGFANDLNIEACYLFLDEERKKRKALILEILNQQKIEENYLILKFSDTEFWVAYFGMGKSYINKVNFEIPNKTGHIF